MYDIFDFITNNWAAIATALFAISEILALTPLKSNSIFQFISGLLKKKVQG